MRKLDSGGVTCLPHLLTKSSQTPNKECLTAEPWELTLCMLYSLLSSTASYHVHSTFKESLLCPRHCASGKGLYRQTHSPDPQMLISQQKKNISVNNQDHFFQSSITKVNLQVDLSEPALPKLQAPLICDYLNNQNYFTHQVRNSVPQLHLSHFKGSTVMCGQCPPDWTVQITEHSHDCTTSCWTVLGQRIRKLHPKQFLS